VRETGETHLEALRSRSLEEVVERTNDDDALALRVDLDAAERPAVLALDVADVDDAVLGVEEGDQLLVAVGLLIKSLDLGEAEFLRERGRED
jgi:hypothetical protein